jgi:hypothetical protein
MQTVPTQRQLIRAKQAKMTYGAVVTLTTPLGNSETFTLSVSPVSVEGMMIIAGAVIRFAAEHCIGACMVETAVLYTLPVAA